MQIRSILMLVCLATTNVVSAQEITDKYVELGIEVQQYSTGFLLGGRAEIGIAAHHALDIRLGYNVFDHQDFGEHDEEKGGGFGITFGYRYYPKPDHRNWWLGIRTDTWMNEVNWKDIDVESDPEFITEGTSKVLVLQPTAIVGYRWRLNDLFSITPTAAFGAEINIKTTGEDVGQGLIFLWGLNVTFRL